MKNLLATLMICAVSASAFAATTTETKAPAKEAKVAAPTTDAKATKDKKASDKVAKNSSAPTAAPQAKAAAAVK